MRGLSLLIFVAGLLLMAAASAPLIEFYETADNIVLQSNVKGNILTITIKYNDSVRMTDYRLAIYYGKKLLNETSGDVLMPGSKANVSINLDDVPDVEKIEIVFQGKIDGLYYVSLRLHR